MGVAAFLTPWCQQARVRSHSLNNALPVSERDKSASRGGNTNEDDVSRAPNSKSALTHKENFDTIVGFLEGAQRGYFPWAD